MRLYLEGNRRLRAPMSQFIRKATGPIKLEITPCGSADDAIKLCADDTDAALVIDSEGEDLNALEIRVKSRMSPSNHAFFMVQLMEAWFLADHDNLATYYGRGFNGQQLPANPNVETILKIDVQRGLRDATRNCLKGAYHKGKHSPELLGQLDPARVYDACPNFARLVDYLRQQSE